MDTYELMTNVRNITKLHSETQLPSMELLRCINLAHGLVSQLLYPLYKEDLVKVLEAASQTGDYDLPKDILLLVNVYRKNTSSVYKPCNKLTIEQKSVIGTPQFPSDANYPIYVQLGTKLSFTPALSTTDIKLEYRKRMAELVWGIGTSASDGTYLTLDARAPVRDDVLNDYWISLYKDTSGDLQLRTQIKISDYTGATKRATCTCPDNSQSYTYALIPVLPDEFHTFIVEMTLVYLAMSNYYQSDPIKLRQAAIEMMLFTLKANGIEYDPKIEGKK